MIVAALMLQTAVAQAVPGELRSAGDWLTWCAPGQGCVAEPVRQDRRMALALRRAGGRGTATTLVLPVTLRRGARARISVDGAVLADVQAPGGGGALALPLDARIGPALRRGRMLSLATPGGRAMGSASLMGIGSAIEAMDEGADSAAPAPITALRRPDKPPRTLSTKEAAKVIPSQPCAQAAPGVTRAVRLEAKRSLALVAAPCADDYILQPLLVDEKGHTSLAEIEGAPAVTRADWDALAHELVLTEPVTPGTGCTGERRFVWTGARFALAERRFQCAGRAAPIVTYRAPVMWR